MSEEIRMTVDARTDYDCEVLSLPSQRWAETVFKIKSQETNQENQEIIIEVSVEKSVIIGIMIGESVSWKGTLEGFKKLLQK